MASLEQRAWYESTRQRLLSQQAADARQSRKDWRHGPSGATYEELRHLLERLRRHKAGEGQASGAVGALAAGPEAERREEGSSIAARSNDASFNAVIAAEAVHAAAEQGAASSTDRAASADEATTASSSSPSLASTDPRPPHDECPLPASPVGTNPSDREDRSVPATAIQGQPRPAASDTARETSSAVPASLEHREAESGPGPPAEASEAQPWEEAAPAGLTSSVGSVRPQDARRVDFQAPTAGASGAQQEAGRRDSNTEKEHGALVRMAAVFEDCTAAVTRVRFSRHRPEIFAYAAADGTLRICHTGPCQGPPRAVLESSGSHHSPLPRAKDTTGSGASSPAKAQGLSRSTSTTGTPRHSSGSNSSSSGGAGAKASPQAGGVGSLAQARSPSQGSGLSASGTPPSPSPTVPAASPASSKASSPSQGAQAHPGRAEDAGRRPRRASKGPQTPRVMHELKGHTKEVTDFDWSSDDEYMASSSLDKSLRVWEVSSGKCLRIIYTELQQLCIRFHPRNSNLLVAANSKPELTVLNFSTGRIVSRVPLSHRVLALEADLTSVLFAGDTESCIHSFTADERSGVLTRHHTNRGGAVHAAATTSLHFRSTSALAKTPVLLACSQDGNVRFFSVAVELEGYLFLKCSLQRSARGPNLAAAFAPSLVADGGTGELIVTGNTDHHVCFFDFSKPRRLFVGKVTGHRGFVKDVSFNITGEWLVSGDASGVVILWNSHNEEHGLEAPQ